MEQSTIAHGYGPEPGTFVSIRPIAKKYEGKTYLGIFLGSVSVEGQRRNPCVWVPDLQEYIFGFESWWGEIESPSQLHQITDADIENVWYVRALRELSTRHQNE